MWSWELIHLSTVKLWGAGFIQNANATAAKSQQDLPLHVCQQMDQEGEKFPQGTDKGAAAEHLEERLHKGKGKREAKGVLLSVWMSWVFPCWMRASDWTLI